LNEPGPFDRMLDSSASRDKNARLILIGMGVIGILLLLLVVLPFSPLKSGGDSGANTVAPGTAPSGCKLPKVPEGYEALSCVFGLPKTEGPSSLTVSLAQAISDGRNLGVYSNKNGKWERLASATLVNSGTAAKADVAAVPANIAVLRRTTSVGQLSGWLPAGAQVDPAALDLLGALNPVDWAPAVDGTLVGSSSQLPNTDKTNILPTVRSASAKDIEAVNTILASPQLREAHIVQLVQLAQQPGNAGIDIDYEKVAPARKPDFNAFVSVLAERLHQAGKTLTLTLPAPTKTGVNWDTGAYDWEELARRADLLKLTPEQDPSQYYKRMEEIVGYLKPKLDLKKVVLVVSRQSREKGSDGLTSLTLRDALTTASALEVRSTSPITPNSSVVIYGKNIFTDDGASGIGWDTGAFAVSFSYPGRGGQRTVWLENSLSLAFRLDFVRRFGLGGVAIEDVSLDPRLPSFWEPLRTFVDTGGATLVQPNGNLLRPTWQRQAGDIDAQAKGSAVWKAPPQPGVYDVSIIVSDGVIRGTQKIIIEVRPAGSTAPTPTGTPRGGATPTATPKP
jgi:hypothetical protein